MWGWTGLTEGPGKNETVEFSYTRAYRRSVTAPFTKGSGAGGPVGGAPALHLAEDGVQLSWSGQLVGARPGPRPVLTDVSSPRPPSGRPAASGSPRCGCLAEHPTAQVTPALVPTAAAERGTAAIVCGLVDMRPQVAGV